MDQKAGRDIAKMVVLLELILKALEQQNKRPEVSYYTLQDRLNDEQANRASDS